MWRDLREGLPEIYGWTITEELPDLEAIGATYVDWIEVDEGPPWSVIEYGERPTKDLAEYRYRLSRARRQAVRGRLKQLVDFVEVSLPSALEDVDRQSRDRLESPDFDEFAVRSRRGGSSGRRHGRATRTMGGPESPSPGVAAAQQAIGPPRSAYSAERVRQLQLLAGVLL